MIKILTLIFGLCPTEDSVGCVWNANHQGNHLGNSFLSLSEDIYIPL